MTRKAEPAVGLSLKAWWGLLRLAGSWLVFGLALVSVAAGILYLQGQGSDEARDAATEGAAVQPFELPDVVSGRTVSLGDYLGKQEIVIVGYMGWFCPGCEELLVELQSRQGDFEERGVMLLVLGSQPEPREVAEQNARVYGITYPLLHDADTRVTREIGLWSNEMQMPWMGYIVIDREGRVVASELRLSEAKGAGPRNVDTILAALDSVMTSR